MSVSTWMLGAERALQQLGHPVDQRGDVHGLRLELLAAREGEQAGGERGAALGAVDGAVEQSAELRIVGQTLAQQVEVAEDRGQQVVEVVREPAGQLADAFHLLRR